MHEVKAILLVGGLGTRLRSVVSSRSKVLASIGQKPFLELLVQQLRSQGIRHLVMCTGYLGSQIESTFGDGRNWDVSIEYSREDSPLGTAGALRQARHYLQDLPEFLVLNGDSFLEVDFHDLLSFHRGHGSVATMAVLPLEGTSRYGIVRIDADGRIISFAEKSGNQEPGLVNGGVYVFSCAIWNYISEGFVDLETKIFPQLLDHGMYGRQQHGMFIDIGTPADYARAQQLLRFL